VLVYPNPATDFIHVDIKGAREPLSITLLNQGGQMMTNKMSQNDRVILNTRNMPNGLYSLVITNSALQKEIHQIAIKH
jgi:Secretion system C-terminal sorting domain